MKVQLPEGYKARFTHDRIASEEGDFNWDVFVPMSTIRSDRDRYHIRAKGGYTTCYILDSNDKHVAMGQARCSMDDNFNRRIGRDIALGRAMKKAGFIQRKRNVIAVEQEHILPERPLRSGV